jgi:uncharacterized membrane protein
MTNNNPRSTVSLRGRPLHAMLVPIPIVCFAARLVTDIVYWRTAAMLWADISAWLLVIGLIVSLFAALILSIFNALIHTRDAYTSVVPSGLILSALVVVILLVTGWNGWTMLYRHGVGVPQAEQT